MTNEPKKKRRWLRRTLIGLGLLLALAFVVAALVPAWLSSDSGRTWLLERVSAEIPGRLTAAGLQLAWGGGQRIDSLVLEDADGATVVRVRSIDTEVTLGQLVRGEFGTGRVVIEGLELDLVLDEEGRLNLAGAVAAPDEEEAEPVDLEEVLRETTIELPPGLKVDVELVDARVALRGPALDKPLAWNDVAGTLKLDAGTAEPVRFALASPDGGLRVELGGLDEGGRLRASAATLSVVIAADPYEARLEVRTSPDGATFTLDAKSPEVTLRAPGRFDAGDGRVSAKGVAVRGVLTPQRLRELAIEGADVELAGDVAVSIDVASVDYAIDGSSLALDANLAIGDGRVDVKVGEVVESLAWSGWAASALKQADGDATAIELKGRIEEGEVDVKGTLKPPLNGDLKASVKKIPLARIDRVLEGFTDGRRLLVDALGPTLDLEGSVVNDGEKSARIELTVDTQRLKVTAPVHVDLESDTVRATDVRIRYTLAPALAPDLGLQGDVPIKLDIASLGARLRAFEPATTTLQATLDVGAALALSGATAEITLADELTLNATCRFDEGSLTAKGRLAGLFDGDLAKLRGKLQATLDKVPVPTGERIDGTVTLQGDGRDASLVVSAKSEHADVALAVLASKGRLRLRETGRAHYRKDDVEVTLALQAIDAPADKTLSLETARAQGTVEVGRLRLDEFEFAGFTAAFDGASLAAPRVACKGRVASKRLREPVNVDVVVEGSIGEQIELRVDGTLGRGTVSVRANLAGRGDDAPLVAKARLDGLPTGLFGELAAECLGKQATIDLDADLPGGWRAGGDVTLTAKAPRLELDARLAGRDEWRLAQPAVGTWQATPAALRVLAPDSELGLAAPATVRLEVTEFAGRAFKARATIATARLRRAKREVAVQGLALDVQAADFRRSVELGVNGKVASGTVRGSVVVDYIGAAEKPMDWSEHNVGVRAQLDIAGIAVLPLDALFDMDGYLHAVLGKTAGGALRFHLKRGHGPIDLTLKAGHLDASVAATVTPRFLLLRRDITAKLTHSKALGDKVLPKLGPFFQGIESTEAPIRVVIGQRGFSVPREFDIAKVVMPRAMLDIGKVTMRNKSLVELVKKLARSRVTDKTVAWFTPAEVSLRRGVLRYAKRLDILMERRFHFSTWGQADLRNERLGMVIGVMPDTLKEILDIRGVGRADTMRLKVTGRLDSPDIDVARAVTDLAAIRAKDDALRNLPELARPFAEAALQKLLRKSFQGPPPIRASVAPLPWKKRRK
ncbi:MAG: hypothetical protein ACYTGN_13045 [Planctomycetota bacterium]